MKRFVKFESSGRIVAIGICADTDFELQPGYPDLLLEIDQDLWIDLNTHKVEDGAVVALAAQPSLNHVFNYGSGVWEISEARVIADALDRRSVLLQLSDWTQLPDVPLATKDQWAGYRQALRDITLQAGYPFEIQWPNSPGN